MFAAYSGHLAVKALSAASSSTLTPINFADPQAQADSGIEILDESATREGGPRSRAVARRVLANRSTFWLTSGKQRSRRLEIRREGWPVKWTGTATNQS